MTTLSAAVAIAVLAPTGCHSGNGQSLTPDGHPASSAPGTSSRPTTSATTTPTPSSTSQPPALDLHLTHWKNAAIPGQLCEVNGTIQLVNGHATVSHSGFGPLNVATTRLTYGNLGGGTRVAALEVWCGKPRGTAASTLAEGVLVFDGAGGTLNLIGTVTAQYHTATPSQLPYVGVASIAAGRIVAAEEWYAPGDPDCCPSGRARTAWSWDGHTLTPGPTMVTKR